MTQVSWDCDDLIRIQRIDSRRPTICFPGHRQKNGRDDILPLLPEAVHLLRTVPKAERTGLVFLPLRGKRKLVASADGIGRVVSAIGKKAKVKTGEGVDGSPMFATAHDLRRSLGDRLAVNPALSPAVVARLMRHRSFDTTLVHYAALRADQIADQAWAALEKGCTLGCNDDHGPHAPSGANSSDKVL